jgi:hypothetical protein
MYKAHADEKFVLASNELRVASMKEEDGDTLFPSVNAGLRSLGVPPSLFFASASKTSDVSADPSMQISQESAPWDFCPSPGW